MDGRVIKPEWLTDMAETYDPKVYTAKLWLDHMRWASYGSVSALKAEKDGDVVRLFAKIAPSRGLLQMSEVWEQYLHFSIEPIEDFAKSGRCYLGGLGMTDNPASLGTDEMRFASMPGRQFSARYAGEKVPDLRETEDDHEMERFGQKLARWFFKNNTPKEEDETMDKEQFKTLTDSLEQFKQTIGSFADQLEKFATEKPAVPAEPAANTDTTPTAGADTKQLDEFKAGLKALDDKFTALLERVEKVAPATKFKETTSAAGDDDELL
jgi:hypothetical protein